MIVDLSIGNANAGGATSQLNTLQNQFNQINGAVQKTTGSLGMFGQAFKGAFIGALTGFAVRATIGNITDLAGGILDAGKNAIIAAGNFQMTTNAMKVFTGSASLARQELGQISDLARNTAGLRLEDAEAGAMRLRALGFAAKTTQDLVVGLAKQKLLSGADETAMNRVIVNITQLASGSPRITQDIKEMVQSMPTLRNAMIDTFGSIEKFKSSLKRDPEGTFQKFADGLKSTQVASAGLNDAFGKMEDEYTRLGRAFGEPVVEPLTGLIKTLTDTLADSRGIVVGWGEDLAVLVNGVNMLAAAINGLPKPGESGNHGWIGSTGGAFGAFGAVGEAIMTGSSAQASGQKFNRNNQDNMWRLRADNTIDFSADPREAAVARATAERNRTAAAERERLRLIDEEKDTVKDQAALTKGFYQIEEAKLKSHLNLTTRDELATAKAMQKLHRDQQIAERSDVAAHYDRLIKLNEDDKTVQFQLQGEKAVESMKKNQEIAKAEIDGMLEVQKAERAIFEERRQANIEFDQIQMQSVRSDADLATSRIETQIDLYETGYGQLIDITQASYAEIARLTDDSYALQLQDASLSAEQRRNIEAQKYQDIEELARGNASRVREIQARSFEQTAKQMREQFQMSQGFASATGGGFQSVLGALTPGIGFGSTLPDIGMQAAFGAQGSGIIRGAVSGVQSGDMSFYQAQALIREKIMDRQLEQLTKEKELNTELIKLENLRAKFALDSANASLQGQIDRQLTNGGTENDVKGLRAEMAANVEQIDRIVRAQDQPVTAEGQRLKNANRLLDLQKAMLGVESSISEEVAKQSLELDTINGITQDILTGRKDALIVQMNELTIAQSRQAAALEFQQQEVLLRDSSAVNATREVELLKQITAMRREELDAVYALDAAQLKINQQMVFSQTRSNAKVAEFLASQKGITDIVSDAKINVLTTAYSGLDSVIGRLTKKFGMFGDAIKDVISGLLKLALNKIFSRMLGIDTTGGSGGGFGLPGLGGGGSASGGGLNLGGLFGGNAGGGVFNFGGAAPLGAMPASGSPNLASLMLGGGSGVGGGTELLGAGKAVGGGGGLLGGSGALAGMAGMLPFLGAGLGASLGGSSKLGTVLGGIGGGLIGAVGAAALPAILAGSFAGLTALGFATLGIGAALIPLAIALNINAARKRDEKTRNQAMLDAFAQIDKLISDVQADRIDGAGALASADQVRASYVDAMSKLKDKKTRGIALKDVSRIDAKITSLRSAVSAQTARRERLDLMVPTFAAGGNVAGFQMGSGHSRSDNIFQYFPAAGTHGYTSPSEYVLDAETAGTIGTRNLDVMRATKGQSYTEMRKRMSTPRMAAGGSFVPVPDLGGIGSSASGGGSPVTLEVTIQVGVSEETFAKIIEAKMKGNNGSTEQMNALVKTLKDGGENALTRELAKQIKPLL